MTNPVIPAEAVEAAKKVAFERYGSKPDTAYLRTILEAAAPHMLASPVADRDAEVDLHLLIKDIRVRTGSATGMMVCSSEDRAQIVQAILAAGYRKEAK